MKYNLRHSKELYENHFSNPNEVFSPKGLDAVRAVTELNAIAGDSSKIKTFKRNGKSSVMGNHPVEEERHPDNVMHGVMRGLIGNLGKLQDENCFPLEAKNLISELNTIERDYRKCLSGLKATFQTVHPDKTYKDFDSMIAGFATLSSAEMQIARENNDRSQIIASIPDSDVQEAIQQAVAFSELGKPILKNLAQNLRDMPSTQLTNGEVIPNVTVSSYGDGPAISVWLYAARRASSHIFDTTFIPESYSKFYDGKLQNANMIVHNIGHGIAYNEPIRATAFYDVFEKSFAQAQDTVVAYNSLQQIEETNFHEVLGLTTQENYDQIKLRAQSQRPHLFANKKEYPSGKCPFGYA